LYAISVCFRNGIDFCIRSLPLNTGGATVFVVDVVVIFVVVVVVVVVDVDGDVAASSSPPQTRETTAPVAAVTLV
jgi:hypothetical protein